MEPAKHGKDQRLETHTWGQTEEQDGVRRRGIVEVRTATKEPFLSVCLSVISVRPPWIIPNESLGGTRARGWPPEVRAEGR